MFFPIADLLRWFHKHARDLPWRKTLDPYGIWISEVMLQQTQVKTVIPYWTRWMQKLPDIASLARAGEPRVLKLWEGLGYYTRARNLQKAARIVAQKYQNQFPQDFPEILELPGIGRYTAGAIASIAYNQARPILDGNVIRVLTRFCGIRQNPRDKTANQMLWRLAEELVDEASAPTFAALIPNTETRMIAGSCSGLNQALMELGALVCTPAHPQCDACPLSPQCVARRRNLTDVIPNVGPRTRSTARDFVAFVVRRDKKLFVRQRGAKGVNARLWEFPNIETTFSRLNPRTLAKRELGFDSGPLKRLTVIQHSITRYRIAVQVFAGEPTMGTNVSSLKGAWKNPRELKALAFSSAHRKILELSLKTEFLSVRRIS